MKTGPTAETAAAAYLQRIGFTVIARNWRTPRCEIDIIAKKDSRLYFVEVKQRSTSRQGTGYEYVTPAKLRQMTFAAELWVAKHAYGGEYQLAVTSVDNDAITYFEVD